MSKEQNIDDILKLLKDSVNTQPNGGENLRSEQENGDISSEALQEKLKNTYFSDKDVDAEPELSDNGVAQSEYAIDSDFLSESEDISAVEEILLPEMQSASESAVSVLVKEEEASDILPEELDETEEVGEFSEELKEISEETIEETEDPEDNIEAILDDMKPVEDDDLPEDNTDELIAALKPSENTESYTEQEDEAFELDEQERIYASISLDDTNTYSDDTAGEASKADASETVDEIPETEEHETFLASMRRTGIDFTTDDIYNASAKKAEREEQKISDEVIDEPIPEENDIDLSTINLMMQFCEKEELEDTIGNAKVDDFLKYEDSTVEDSARTKVTDGKEYVDAGQNETILAAYKKKKSTALWSLIGCALIAIVAFIYELMPLVEVRAEGVFDYGTYPSVYVLVGLQFVVFAAAICHRQIWDGLKRAFSLTPNTYSIVGIIFALTAVCDIIIAIILAFTRDDLPPMFNATAVVVCTLCMLADYLDICAEMRAFGVYSSNAGKYTLVKETKEGSVGAKMYSGGLEADKTIYSVHSVEFPNGFFRSLEKTPKTNRILATSIIPVLVAAIIAAIVAVLVGADAYASTAAFMICLYAVLPTVLILTDILPYAIACIKLSSRGSAFAGRGAIEKYDGCDVLVFNDLHLFKKCKTEDVGVAIYDTGVGYLTLGCLDALYSSIGGPLSGMQMNLPEVFKFKNVDLKRITRNGIEAVIEKKHTLIVGEPSFMKRYGLTFPENEQDNDRLTLCVSLGGKVTAKLSVKYETEPVFEMLVERLSAEGISCAIQTYDPLINSAMISRVRTVGDAPVSVIHKNTEDFGASKQKRYRGDEDGVISCGSRLKLVEVEVWLKRLAKVKKLCERTVLGCNAFGLLAMILLVAFNVTGYVNQLHVLLFLLAETAAVCIPMIFTLPNKKYFTVDALYSELEREHEKQMRKADAMAEKQRKKAYKKDENE